MGQLVNLKCKKCGYQTNLGIGAGKRFIDLETVLDLFDKETQGKIRDIVGKNAGKGWLVSKEIGICEKCGKISAVAVFEMTDIEGKEIQFKAKCPCGADVELADREAVLDGRSSITCPACGDELEITMEGFWD